MFALLHQKSAVSIFSVGSRLHLDCCTNHRALSYRQGIFRDLSVSLSKSTASAFGVVASIVRMTLRRCIFNHPYPRKQLVMAASLTFAVGQVFASAWVEHLLDVASVAA